MIMQSFETKPRKWGNSYGVIIPKEIFENEKLGPNQRIRVTIEPEGRTLGQALWESGAEDISDKSTDEIMRIIDEELWGMK